MSLLDEMTAAMDDKEYVLGVFIDLKKAFDTIDHDILCSKLKFYGIRGCALDWIRSYLSNRFQKVKIKENVSSEKKMTCGVPQGSILGPLLFIMYINDICQVSETMSLILFADDTNLFMKDKCLDTLANRMTEELDKIQDWLNCNKLSLNVLKTNFMIFTTNAKNRNLNKPLNIKNTEIKQVKSTKFLGVKIQENLKWDEHIASIKTKLSRATGIIRKVKNDLPPKSLKQIYDVLFVPHLNYCNVIWGHSCVTHLEPLWLLQKRAIRSVTGSEYLAHTSPLFKTLKTLKLEDMTKLATLTYMYKNLNDLLPKHLTKLCETGSVIHDHDTRGKNLLRNEKTRSRASDSTPYHKGIDLWNKLDDTICKQPSLKLFRRSLKEKLVDTYE